jgi:hypothetical protein
MYQVTKSAYIAPVFMALLLGNIGEGGAQPAQTQQERYSGGTQGLQEKLYEERLKELQDSHAQGGQQLRSMEGSKSSVDQFRGGDTPTRPTQGGSGGRSADSGRQTDQPVKK